MSRFLGRILVLAMGTTLLAAWGGVRPAVADPPDPLLPLLNRMEAYFHRQEIDGITQDSRYALNPTETIRLSVVSQLLAFEELAAVQPHGPHAADVRERADFLIAHLAEIRSGTPFDGMLGYALLTAAELTGDPRHFAAGEAIVLDVMRPSGFSNTLNWGLMSAMATAKYYDLTGSPSALAKTQEIVASLRNYQNPDGSFPHYCPGSADVHYTGWMGMELIHVRRFVPSPVLDDILDRIAAFLAGRVLGDGHTSYETPCTLYPHCTRYYYSRASGCGFDYDTRAWINELGYTGMVLEAHHASAVDFAAVAASVAGGGHGRGPEERAVMGFLYDLEDHGAVDDKWDLLPPPGDPLYPWATGHPSVIRTSVVFWSLASMYRERQLRDAGAAEPADPAMHAEPFARSIAPESTEAAAEERWRSFEWTTVDRMVLEGTDPESACDGQREIERRRTPGSGAREADGRIAASGALRAESRGAGAAFHFALERDAYTSLEIFDLTGRRVIEIDLGSRAAGEHEVAWDGCDVRGAARSNGVYFARLRNRPGGSGAIRFTLLR